MQEAEALAAEKPRFMHKTVRGYQPNRGPKDVLNPSHYNQKLRTFLEDSLDECEDTPIAFPAYVEAYFKENLLKRYNLIRYLKAEIRREKAKNQLRRKFVETQKGKTEQRQLSKNLVSSFKDCIDQVLAEKDARMAAASKDGKFQRATRSELKDVERRKILENFVENDEALGQLLDFISSHYIQSNE